MYKQTKPSFGSAIRVNRGLYQHYGIYIDDEHVIHFSAGATESILDAKDKAMIIESDLNTFLQNGVLETLIIENENEKPIRQPIEVVNYAYSKIGTKGYNLVTNNCEHFVNECLYNKKYSNQVNNVASLLAHLFH